MVSIDTFYCGQYVVTNAIVRTPSRANGVARLATAAGLAVLPVATLLPVWLGVATVAVVAIVLFRLIVAASRARGVCEGWTRSAMRMWDVVALYGPAVVVTNAAVFMSRLAWWSPIVAAVLVFALFAGTALALSARAGRR
jgi:membrane glycosyltransferase